MGRMLPMALREIGLNTTPIVNAIKICGKMP